MHRRGSLRPAAVAARGSGTRGSGKRLALALGLLAPPAQAIAQPVDPAAGDPREIEIEVGPNVHVSAELSERVHVEPMIAASPFDPLRLVAASMIVRDPHSAEFQDSWSVVVYASRDGGRSWSRRPLPGLPDDWMAGDVWLAWDANDVVHLSCIATASMLEGEPVSTWAFRSTDGGWTWSEPERGIFGAGTTQDHPVLSATVDGEGAPLVYAFGTKAAGDEEGVDLAVLEPGSVGSERRSEPARFRPLASFTTERRTANLGGAVGLPGGGVLFTWFRMPDPPRGLWAVHGDGRGTFEETRLREGILPVSFPTLAVDRSDGPHAGRAYATWVEGADPRDQRDLRVLVAHTDDGGRTWSEPTPAHRHSAPTQRTMPFVAVNDAGTVAVAWMDWRGSPDRSDCPELWLAASTDGGATFHPEVRVSSERSCFGTPANGAAARRWRLGGGEYLGVAAAADGSFHVAWPDSRTGRFQVWTAKVRVRGHEPGRAPGSAAGALPHRLDERGARDEPALRLTLLGTFAIFPTGLPVPYLRALSGGRDVQESSSLDETIGFVFQAGVPLGERWTLTGDVGLFAPGVTMTLPATRTRADAWVLMYGAGARYSLGEAYLVAGAGATRLDPDALDAETGFGGSVGIGRRAAIYRWELRYRASLLNLVPGEGSTLHHALLLGVGFSAGVL